MDIQEMHIGVNLGVQKVNSNAFDNFLPEEIDYYLNKAQREYIRRQNSFLKKDIENVNVQTKISTTEAIENLGGLIKTHSFSGLGIASNQEFDNAFDVNSTGVNMFQYIYANAKIDTNKWVPCKLISPYDIHIYSQAEYNEPLFRRLPLLIAYNKFIIFHDTKTTSISNLELMYISTPATVSLSGEVDSDLPIHTHDEIVDIAVGMILGDLKSVAPSQYEQRTIPKEL